VDLEGDGVGLERGPEGRGRGCGTQRSAGERGQVSPKGGEASIQGEKRGN